MSALITDIPSAEEETPEAHLRVCFGQSLGRRYRLNGAAQVLGATGHAHIALNDQRVSKQHAKIVVRKHKHVIYDLQSTNGVFVNEQRVVKAELRDGDVIQVGETLLKYRRQWDERDLYLTVPLSSDSAEIPTSLKTLAEKTLLHARIPRREKTERALIPYPTPRKAQSIKVLSEQHPTSPPTPALRVSVSEATREDESEVSLKDLLLQLRSIIAFFLPYWKSILAFAVVGMGLGAASYFAFPPAQTAVFEVSLVVDVAENPVHRFERNNVEFFRSAEQNFRSVSLIESTLAKLGEKEISPERLNSVQNSLEFGVAGGSSRHTYRGTYSNRNGDEAVAFLERHAELYLKTEVEKTLKVIKVEADFLQKQLDDTEAELRRTEAQLLEFKKEHIDGLPEQARQYYDYLFELQQQQSESGTQLSRIRAQIRLHNDLLESEPRLIQSRVLATRPYQTSLVRIRQQIAERKASGLGEDHPELQRLQQQVAELKTLAENASDSESTEIERTSNPNYEALQTSLHQHEVSEEVAQKEAARVTRDLARVREIVARLPALEAKHAELTRSYDSTKNLHARIFQQLKTARLQLELERVSAAARYDIITPPRIEFFSPEKRIVQRASPIGMIGLLFGFGLTTARQLRKREDENENVED